MFSEGFVYNEQAYGAGTWECWTQMQQYVQIIILRASKGYYVVRSLFHFSIF